MTEKISASYLLLRGWLGRLAAIGSSTFVLTVLFLMLFDVGLREIQPLRYLNHTGLTTIHQNSLVSKLPVALADPRQADVLLMGSSLMLFPCVRCDDEYHGVKTRYNRWYMRN